MPLAVKKYREEKMASQQQVHRGRARKKRSRRNVIPMTQRDSIKIDPEVSVEKCLEWFKSSADDLIHKIKERKTFLETIQFKNQSKDVQEKEFMKNVKRGNLWTCLHIL